jgi:hypothetical protein
LGIFSKTVAGNGGDPFSLTPARSRWERGNAPSVLAKLKRDSACELTDFKKLTNDCSFSQREKVRMRGNVIHSSTAGHSLH